MSVANSPGDSSRFHRGCWRVAIRDDNESRKMWVVTTTMARTSGTVRLSAVGRDIGLPRTAQAALIENGLVTPVDPVVRGRPARIPDEEAAQLQRAAEVATATGVSIVIVLKVLKALVFLPELRAPDRTGHGPFALPSAGAAAALSGRTGGTGSVP